VRTGGIVGAYPGDHGSCRSGQPADRFAVHPVSRRWSGNRPLVRMTTADDPPPPMESIVRGDSDRVAVVREGIKAKVADLLPGGPDG
jgi:hypothetical protein